MKNIRAIIALTISLLAFSTKADDKANQIIDSVLSNYNVANITAATYSVTGSGVDSNGTILMSKEQFRILSDQITLWYDGTTQWSYISQIGEVNITEPTAQELRMTNPYAALQNIDNDYSATLMPSSSSSSSVIKLTPKTDSFDATEIELTINNTTKQITKALFKTADNNVFTILISNYEKIDNPDSTVFKYNPLLLPNGTPVIDLR